MNEKILLKYAIDYLSKYDSSKNNLIDVLKRKIFRMNISGIDKNKLINLIGNIIEKLEKNNFLDDRRYSMAKILSFSRQGKSKIFIHNYLIKKGIDKNEIQDYFNTFKINNNEWEMNAALLFAKKKNLIKSTDSYEKKLGKMARAGFNYELCKIVLG